MLQANQIDVAEFEEAGGTVVGREVLLLQLEAYEPAPLEDEGAGFPARPEGKPLPAELENKLRRTLLQKGGRGRNSR